MNGGQTSDLWVTRLTPYHAHHCHISSVVTWSWCGSWMKAILSATTDAGLTTDVELTTVWSCRDRNLTSKYDYNVENLGFQRSGTSDCPGWQNLNALLSCHAANILRFASWVKLRNPGCWHSRWLNTTGEAAHQGLIGHRLQSGSIETTVVFTCTLSFTNTLDDSSICLFLGWLGVSWFICRMRPLVCPRPPPLKSWMSWLIQGEKQGWVGTFLWLITCPVLILPVWWFTGERNTSNTNATPSQSQSAPGSSRTEMLKPQSHL